MEHAMGKEQVSKGFEAERARLLGELRGLREELGTEGGAAWEARNGWPPVAIADGDDRRLLASFQAALSALVPAGISGRSAREVDTVLDGAALAARTEIVTRNLGSLRELFAGLAYLVVLAASGPDEALRIARLAAQHLGVGAQEAGAV